MYTVKQVSEMLEMNPHTVRFYTDNELIPNLQRGKNNVRLFDEEAVNWLTGVKVLRECGMTLDAIKRYVELCLIGEEALPERIEIVREQQAKVNEEIEKLQKCSAYLSDKLDFYQRLQTGEEEVDRTDPGQWSKEPAKIANI